MLAGETLRELESGTSATENEKGGQRCHSSNPERGMASRCQEETAQQASQQPVRAETFGNRVGHALIIAQEAYSETPPVWAPDVGSYDDGVNLLKCDAGC